MNTSWSVAGWGHGRGDPVRPAAVESSGGTHAVAPPGRVRMRLRGSAGAPTTPSSSPGLPSVKRGGTAALRRQHLHQGDAHAAEEVRCLRPMPDDSAAPPRVIARAALPLATLETHSQAIVSQCGRPEVCHGADPRQRPRRPLAAPRWRCTSSRCHRGRWQPPRAAPVLARAACVHGAGIARSGRIARSTAGPHRRGKRGGGPGRALDGPGAPAVRTQCAKPLYESLCIARCMSEVGRFGHAALESCSEIRDLLHDATLTEICPIVRRLFV